MKNPVHPVFTFPEVRVVEASAGSGKTYALAKRYVQLVLNPDLEFDEIPIRNILAITFTNKAAFEMKSRIIEMIKRVALKKLSSLEKSVILDPLGAGSSGAPERAFVMMEQIIRHYNFFQVQTIDSFMKTILSGCAFKMGVSADFRVKTAADEFLRYSLDMLIDKAHADKTLERDFELFLHNYLYLENRSAWFPRDDILDILSELYHKVNTYGGVFRESPFDLDAMIKKKRSVLKDMKALYERLPEETHATFRKSFARFIENCEHGFDIDDVPAAFARDDFPVRKGGEVPREVDALWRKIGSELRAVVREEAASLYNPYIRLFNDLWNIFQEAARKEDVIFLEELNRRARTLFADGLIDAGELYYRLATRFRHYLIDEFQDTSRLQWDNIKPLAEEAVSSGGTLFYVGDRKQAIYGFRGGDAGLFDEVKGGFGEMVRTERLETNRRSLEKIVEFNNILFSAENLRRFIRAKEEDEKKKSPAVVFSEKDISRVEAAFAGAAQAFLPEHSGGRVRIEFVDAEKKEDRDEVIRVKLLELVREVSGRFRLGDIAVLTRSNAEIEQVTRWLMDEHIFVESERTSNVKNNRAVTGVIACLKFLESPIDNMSFSQFILSDVFLKAARLEPRTIQDFLFSLRGLMTREKDVFIYTEFRKAYPEIWNEFLDEFFRNIGLFPLYETVVSLYGRFRVSELFPDDQGFLMRFLELIKRSEDEHADLGGFLEYFESLEGADLYVETTDEDAVRLITVHKSKGLEFPVVIIPFLGMDVQTGETISENRQSYTLEVRADGLRMLRLKSRYYPFSDELFEIYATEYKRALLNELNNAYVALTRPRCELYAFVPSKTGRSRNIIRYLIPEEIRESGRPGVYPQKKDIDLKIRRLPAQATHDWIHYLKEEFPAVHDAAGRSRRLEGEVLHCMLSFVGNLSVQSPKDALEKAVLGAKAQFPAIKNFHDYERRVERILHESAFRPFFFAGEKNVHTEKEFVNAQGHALRVDRLIVGPKEIFIIDYKSSREEKAGHEKQVRGYMDLLGRIYREKKIEGRILYLDEHGVEIVGRGAEDGERDTGGRQT